MHSDNIYFIALTIYKVRVIRCNIVYTLQVIVRSTVSATMVYLKTKLGP